MQITGVQTTLEQQKQSAADELTAVKATNDTNCQELEHRLATATSEAEWSNAKVLLRSPHVELSISAPNL